MKDKKLKTDKSMNRDASAAIRQLRKEAGMNQGEFAEYIGVPRGTINAWELGTRFPRKEGIDKILAKFNVDYNFITGNSPIMNSDTSVKNVRCRRVVVYSRNEKSVPLTENGDISFASMDSLYQVEIPKNEITSSPDSLYFGLAVTDSDYQSRTLNPDDVAIFENSKDLDVCNGDVVCAQIDDKLQIRRVHINDPDEISLADFDSGDSAVIKRMEWNRFLVGRMVAVISFRSK